jgi:predicted alpha/beta hydrolase family esterase
VSRALHPFASRTPVLLVPGLGGSEPGHWQTLWQQRFADMHRVVQEDFDDPRLDAWAARIARAIGECATPPVVAAHGFGCLAFARAVAAHPVAAAAGLLVAPADGQRFGIADALIAHPLPMPTLLVASTNDPGLKFVQAGALAMRWGSRLVSVGGCGHINVQSGHGEWPVGLALLRDLAERAAAAGTLALGAGRAGQAAGAAEHAR